MKTIDPSRLSRRQVLGVVAGSAVAGLAPAIGPANAAADVRPSLEGIIGLTTGSLNHQRKNRILTARTLPKFFRDDLGMSMIDLNTNWLESFDEEYIAAIRRTTEEAGCFISNLKVNHEFGDLYDSDPVQRMAALTHAKELIRAAHGLGARWIRFPVPLYRKGDRSDNLAAHRELARSAGELGIALLVENNGWMRSDPTSVPRVVAAIGNGCVAGPDTGNWNDDIREEALAAAFPGAATCDFKVFELDADGRHGRYDIRKCFAIGWQAGFRGPWAIEHWNDDLEAFARETVLLADRLRDWTKESS